MKVRKTNEIEQQGLLAQAAERSDRLSLVLYQRGGASHLQVLTNETNYFAAELNLVQAQLNSRRQLARARVMGRLDKNHIRKLTTVTLVSL